MKKILAILTSLLVTVGCSPHEVKLAKRISKSTVLVHMRVTKGNKYFMGTCSGVVVSPHEILLANHCVDPQSDGIKLDKIWIRNFNGRSQEAKVERTNPTVDLALLKVKKSESPARLANSIKVGEDCWAVGMPLGLNFIVTKGIISHINFEHSYFPKGSFFITDAAILPGNSGCGVWNSKGQLIGIASMSTSLLGALGAVGLGFIVDIKTIRKFLK